MNTAVALTSEICRTVLWLAAIAGGVITIRPVLPRVQVAATKTPPRTPETAVTVLDRPADADALAAAGQDGTR